MTQDEAIESAGTVLAQARHTQSERTPRQAAEAAFVPGGPSVDEIEDRIRVRRGMAARKTDEAA